MVLTMKQVHEAQKELARRKTELSNAYIEYDMQVRTGKAPMLSTAEGFTARERKAVEQQAEVVAELQAQVGGPVYRVPTGNLDILKHDIEKKVNKRARKLGLADVQVIEGEEEIIESPDWDSPHRDEHGKPPMKKHVWRYVAIKGETPKIKGYEFVATIQHLDQGNIMRTIPQLAQEVRNIEVPDTSAYRDADPGNCDHCKKFRYRNDTYIVFNAETGDMKQVGSNCLGDFLGAADPNRYAKYAEYLSDFLGGLSASEDDEGGYGGRVERIYDLDEFVGSALCMIREYGWTSRSNAGWGGSATADQAWDNLENYGKYETSRYGSKVPLWKDITEDDMTKAQEVIEWVRSMDNEDAGELNDYLHNLVVAFRGDYVSRRLIGIVASAPVAFDKAREREIKRRKQAERNSEKGWVGEIKKRQEFHGLTLTRTIWIEDRYSYDGGSKPLYIFEDEAGNEIKWFSSNDLNFREGDTYSLKATVKDHADHERFGKSTVITRAVVLNG